MTEQCITIFAMSSLITGFYFSSLIQICVCLTLAVTIQVCWMLVNYTSHKRYFQSMHVHVRQRVPGRVRGCRCSLALLSFVRYVLEALWRLQVAKFMKLQAVGVRSSARISLLINETLVHV